MQCRRFSDIQTDEWFLFPRQREGNIYAVNWSLVEDGVTPVGDAFRNAELSTLTKKIGSKVQNGKFELSKPLFFGDFILQESGDHISHDEFSMLFKEQQMHLESGISLYVEDAGIGAYNNIRNGVRVIAEDPALALIARNLLVRYISFMTIPTIANYCNTDSCQCVISSMMTDPYPTQRCQPSRSIQGMELRPSMG